MFGNTADIKRKDGQPAFFPVGTRQEHLLVCNKVFCCLCGVNVIFVSVFFVFIDYLLNILIICVSLS